MSTTYIGAVTVIFALVGAMAALILPSSTTTASSIASVRLNPGPTYAYLTTDWHGTTGKALDWGHENGGYLTANTTVYWRSYGYRGDTGTATQIGSVSVATIPGTTCKTVRATFTDSVGDVESVDVNLVHTYKSGTAFFYVFGRSSYYWQSYGVAKIAADENTNCKNANPPLWTAAHLHQEPLSSWSAATYNYTDEDEWYSSLVTSLSGAHANYSFPF